MIVYQVGVHRNRARRVISRRLCSHVLSAYDYFRDREVDRGFRRVCLAHAAGVLSGHFLDSGAHSLFNRHVAGRVYDWFDSTDFRAYQDAYATFVRRWSRAVDHYVNLDVIFDPQRTWDSYLYLCEVQGLQPLPVVHCGTSVYWLRKYLDRGCDFVCLGGLGQVGGQERYRIWADLMFKELCPPPRYEPLVRVHGFAMTSHSLMVRYPWYSVDSATWIKAAAFGGILVPPLRRSQFDFGSRPLVLQVSERSPGRHKRLGHYNTIAPNHRRAVDSWLDSLGVALGDEQTAGVTNDQAWREEVNLRYFGMLTENIPPWPRAFRRPVSHSFNL